MTVQGLRSVLRRLLGAMLVAAVAAGCGGSGSSHGATSHQSSSAAGGQAAASSQSSTAPLPGPNAKLTAPGATLKLGQSAIVDFGTTLANGNDGPNYRLQVTVLSITHGALADFKNVSLSGIPKATSPTYVKLRMTNISGKSFSTSQLDPAFAVQAVRSDGTLDNSLIISGYFPPCPNVSTPNPFGAGQSFTTCETYFEHGEATKIGYNGSNATLDSPVIWSP